MKRQIGKLCEKLGYSFVDPGLLAVALTHCSAPGPNNERLEFLGDGVLNFIIADALYQAFPDAREGELSKRRASLVRRETLARIAARLQLGDCLVLGSGELKSGGFRRASILADGLEAVIGAIYCDGGYRATRKCVLHLFDERLAKLPDMSELKDAKTRLQELLQARGLGLPEYQVVDVAGAAHEQTFKVECAVAELSISANGTGSSRRQAEQEAAHGVLDSVADT